MPKVLQKGQSNSKSLLSSRADISEASLAPGYVAMWPATLFRSSWPSALLQPLQQISSAVDIVTGLQSSLVRYMPSTKDELM